VSEYEEDIDLTVEPWKALATLCWNEPSPFRMGHQAEMDGVAGSPYKRPLPRALFEEGRATYRKYYPAINAKGAK
jgi:hypothetical protein